MCNIYVTDYRLRNVASVEFQKKSILCRYHPLTVEIWDTVVWRKLSQCHRTDNKTQKEMLLYGLGHLESTEELWKTTGILHFYGVHIQSAVVSALKINLTIGSSLSRDYDTRFANHNGFSHRYTRLEINESLIDHRLVKIKTAQPKLFF